MDYGEIFDKYVSDVSSGEKRVCRWERLAVERHLRDLTRDDVCFDRKAGIRACNFFKLLKHYKGPLAGTQFALSPWQVFATACIFGWLRKSDGCRKYNYADILVPRKNGKSTWAAGIALYMMMMLGEAAAEIYSAGTDRDQASVVWTAAKEMAQASPAIGELLHFYNSKNSIVMESTASFFKPLSKEVGNKDGSNPFCAICDERHAWKSNDMFDVLKSGCGARKGWLIFSITTAGKDISVPYFTQLDFLKGILEGRFIQDNQFVMLWLPDDGDDWKDPEVWKMVNPNYGISVYPEYLQAECDEATKKGGTYEANFKTKNLNIWVNAPDIWISDDKVTKCNFETNINTLRGKKCFAGLDIASHVDLNALALIFPYEPHCPCLMRFWAPATKIDDPTHGDVVDYAGWEKGGLITRMDGAVLDPEQMAGDIAAYLKMFNCQALAFDPYKAYHGTIQTLQKLGLGEMLVEYGQGIGNISEPTKKLESMVLGGEIDLMGNPVMRWMFGNVVLFVDNNGNFRINKAKSRNKIDGIAALVDAIGAWMNHEAQSRAKQIYSSHTLRTVRM